MSRPGDRAAGETDVAYQAFRAYVEAGPSRSIRAIAEQLGKQPSVLKRWSTQHGWVQRVADLETEQARRVDDSLADARVEAARRQAVDARVHAAAATQISRALLQRIQADPTVLQNMNPVQLAKTAAMAARAYESAQRAERLALGMTTDQPGSEIDPGRDAATLTDEELAARLAGLDDAPATG